MAKKNGKSAEHSAAELFSNHPMIPTNGGINICVVDAEKNRGKFIVPMTQGMMEIDLERPDKIEMCDRILVGRFCFASFAIAMVEQKNLPDAMKSPALAVWGDGWMAWSLGQDKYAIWLKHLLKP